MARNQRPVSDSNLEMRPHAEHLHLLVAGSNERPSWRVDIAMLSLLNIHLTDGVEPFRKRGREKFRHVLHDYDAGRLLRHCRQNLCQSLGSTSGSADGNNPACAGQSQ